ncbi:PorT family protein [Flavobacteriaceae bacterium]|jgi:hypothetical protein|nr:PorT family protein [Flavobacteriaceae bacterium]MDB4050095.1 PorT family protein [Flavobacteriaceae bacterium]
MRIFLLFLSFYFLSISIYSQKNKTKISYQQGLDQQKIHFGYFIGLNSYDYKFEESDIKDDREVLKKIGFNVGLIGDLKLKKNLNLRFEPGLYINKSDFEFETSEVKKNSSYIHLPILLKYSAQRLNNFKPYLLGGLSASYNLSSNQNSSILDENLKVKKLTFNYELGFGIDLYFQYFKFSPSIRGVFSLSDELFSKNNELGSITGNIDKMSARAIFINFSFH